MNVNFHRTPVSMTAPEVCRGGTREAEGEKAVLRVGAANAAFKQTGAWPAARVSSMEPGLEADKSLG